MLQLKLKLYHAVFKVGIWLNGEFVIRLNCEAIVNITDPDPCPYIILYYYTQIRFKCQDLVEK